MISLARLLAALAAVAAAVAPAPAQAPAKSGAAAVKPIPISVATAETRPVQRSVETVGSLVPWQDVQVKTEQAGTVARLYADLGDAVRAGAVLAEYDAREFELGVAQAEADLLSARQSLARARSAVEASEAALRRARDNRSALEAEVARAVSQVEWAKSELERNQELFRRELIAARDVDNARNLHNVAAAQHAVALNALALHPDQVRIAEAQLESDHAGLRVAEAEVTRREATLGIQRKRLSDTTIKSSMAGFIARRHLNPGEYVKENTVLFTVVALDPLKFTGTVPERVAPELKVGQRLELSVEAYPGQIFAGQVSRLSPAVEVQTRSLALEARVPNSDGRLRPGFFAKGVVLTRKEASVPFAPAEAVVYFVGITKVFVVVDGMVKERVVKTGARQGAWVEIVEGVRAGDRLAVSNLPELFDGAAVTVTGGPSGKAPSGK